MQKSKLTLSRLRELVTYDPLTGIFRWVSRPSKRVRVGDVAGGVDKKEGYVRIRLDGICYHGHRLAWFYMTGAWPSPDADHRNLRRSDNRWDNLRESTRSQNMGNAGVRVTNTSGFKGVWWDRARGKWSAEITVKYKKYSLGRFLSATDAARAYDEAALKHFGEFARLNFPLIAKAVGEAIREEIAANVVKCNEYLSSVALEGASPNAFTEGAEAD